MKKIIIFLFALTTIGLIKTDNEEYLIPSESIRFRVIANSNTSADQIIKTNLVSKLQETIIKIENTSNTIEESRNNIELNISEIEKILETENLNYSINYGYNYFPEKNYKGIVYNGGNYESLVIEIGEAKGDNWWCVLYPPLCNLELESSDKTDLEYSFYLKNIIDQLN